MGLQLQPSNIWINIGFVQPPHCSIFYTKKKSRSTSTSSSSSSSQLPSSPTFQESSVSSQLHRQHTNSNVPYLVTSQLSSALICKYPQVQERKLHLTDLISQLCNITGLHAQIRHTGNEKCMHNFGKKNFRYHFGELGEDGIILRQMLENLDVKV
jgi:hypothetical protein